MNDFFIGVKTCEGLVIGPLVRQFLIDTLSLGSHLQLCIASALLLRLRFDAKCCQRIQAWRIDSARTFHHSLKAGPFLGG
ncbi:hypothetical protein TX24_17550 [Pseudomonas lactis]|nr:hypothetical protein TX24_17550 [Pseudomonas lactis]